MMFEVFMRYFSIFIFLIMTGAALADPPMKTVYSDSSTTKFSWTWPYHTTQSKTLVVTHLAPEGSGYKIFNPYCPQGELSKFRYHHAHLTYQNQWGYFFPAGTKPVKSNTGDFFITPQGYILQYNK
jgi:hypothetical protein